MVNKVILIGNLGQDPEIKYSQNNTKIATFSLATAEYWKDKATGERKSLTQWHRVVVFNDNLSTVAEKFLKKGSKIYLEGSIQTRKYTGPDGVEKQITEIVVGQFKGEIQMMDTKLGNSLEDDAGNPYTQDAPSVKKEPAAKKAIKNVGDDLDDEIPF